MRPILSMAWVTSFLAGLGVLPIMALAWALLGLAQPPAMLWQALLAYAALILAFLGGIYWGQGLALQRPLRLVWAVLPPLYSWVAMLLPTTVTLAALALGFAVLAGVDGRDSSLPTSYRRLRVIISVLVVVHLLLVWAWAAPPASLSSKQGDLAMEIDKNVLGTPLEVCSMLPRTGFYRNGRCETGPDDRGTHTVCALMTEEFLSFTLERGNDLITPRPDYNFPGLNPGDRWCLCALRWEEARRAGVAPPVILEATHARTLDLLDLADLMQHALR